MSKKYHIGEILSLEIAMLLYKNGISVVVCDGEFVQIEINKGK